jgi:hypothetical protein
VVSVPRIEIEIPVEGSARARLVCASWDEEIRIARDLERRDVVRDIIEAIIHLADALALAEAGPS